MTSPYILLDDHVTLHFLANLTIDHAEIKKVFFVHFCKKKTNKIQLISIFLFQEGIKQQE